MSALAVYVNLEASASDPTLSQHGYPSYRSLCCTSQNTEIVIQTFWQPTAAFFSE